MQSTTYSKPLLFQKPHNCVFVVTFDLHLACYLIYLKMDAIS